MNAKDNIKSNLRFLVKAAGFTRRQFAGYIGVKEKALNAYMEGRSCPSIQTLIEVADLFHVSVDDIVRHDIPARFKITGVMSIRINTVSLGKL